MAHGRLDLGGNRLGLLLLAKPGSSREALARELREHLRALGVDYHVRTLKRQLAGSPLERRGAVAAVARADRVHC